MALLILLAIRLPHPEWFDPSHFQLAIGGSIRIVIASVISYVCGDFVNDRIFRAMKKKHANEHKGFSSRAWLSSLGGEIVDTTMFVFIAFSLVVPFSEFFGMIWVSVVLKTGYELIILPVTNIVARKVKAYEGDKVFG
jgi:uncharacterized integral membrane protein (TIGR00697 family)